jgi:hypothetical protein
MSSHESDSGCPDCGHDLMEHGPSGCTHGLHVDGLVSDVCGCRRGRHDPLDEEAE